MTDNSFTTINSNNLEEIHMIAGDTKTLFYNVMDENGSSIDISNSTGEIVIFKYGDAGNIITSASCIISGSPSVINQFSTTFSGSGLSGLYQQQFIYTDSNGIVYKPGQGKIVIFPSNNT